jgi:uncharacterized membrane protein
MSLSSFWYRLYESSSGSALACNGTEETMTLKGDYSSTACFYVFVGVFSFLFTIFAVVVYVFFQPTYEFMEWIPITVSCFINKKPIVGN